jgi:hypothetical protein
MKYILGSVLIAAVLAGCSGGASSNPTPQLLATEPAPPAVVEPDPTMEPVVTPAPAVLPKSYAAPNKRDWAKIVKTPDKYSGKGYKVWACIWQFDAATGEGAFMGYSSYKKQTYWATDADNSAFVGDATKLSDFVEGDIVTMNVMGLGSYSYDTQAGGNTTVPMFQVVSIKQQKGTCN